jgi:hypothetical protein
MKEPVLVVTGEAKDLRFGITLRGRTQYLTGTSFYYLFRLAMHAVEYPGEGLPKAEIAPGDNGHRYVYRLRREIGYAGRAEELLPRASKCTFRLNLKPDEIVFNHKLLDHPDARIAEAMRRSALPTSSYADVPAAKAC